MVLILWWFQRRMFLSYWWWSSISITLWLIIYDGEEACTCVWNTITILFAIQETKGTWVSILCENHQIRNSAEIHSEFPLIGHGIQNVVRGIPGYFFRAKPNLWVQAMTTSALTTQPPVWGRPWAADFTYMVSSISLASNPHFSDEKTEAQKL